MSKYEVLTQIYPDELKYIFDKKREKEIKRYQGYFNQIMAVAAGIGGGDSANEYVQDIISHIKELSNTDNKSEGPSINDLYQEKKKLHSKDSLSEDERLRLKELNNQIKEKLDQELGIFKSIAPGGDS